MNRLLGAALLGVAFTPFEPGPVAAQAPSYAQHSNIDYAYVPPDKIVYVPLMRRLKARRVLEQLSEFLAPLRLPHAFFLETKQCDTVNAFYSSSTWSLNICYELVEFLEGVAPEADTPVEGISRDEVLAGALVGVVLHELGHAVFDMLQVPVFGREEDAADQMASFIALQFSKDVARTVVRSYAYLYLAFGGAPTDWGDYSDEHGTNPQRFYNTLCLGYGSDPEFFKDFVDRGWLPKERADNCAAEYQQLKHAFVTTVLPFIDPEQMKAVQARQWLAPQAPR
jgi:hypothetical protein